MPDKTYTEADLREALERSLYLADQWKVTCEGWARLYYHTIGMRFWDRLLFVLWPPKRSEELRRLLGVKRDA